MQSRWPALLVVGLVLLAGCSGTGPTGVTPENPQTTYAPTGSETVSSPPALTVVHSGDDPTTVRVTLAGVTNGTTFYDRETTMTSGSQRYLTSEVADRGQYRVTVSAANATHTHDVYAVEGYVVTVANDSAIHGRHTTD